MAEEITLDTLMQGKENTALQKQEPVDVETVCTQIEELTPEQRARVEELKICLLYTSDAADEL